MKPLNNLTLIAGACILTIVVAYYFMQRNARPKHVFIGYDLDNGTGQPYVLRTMSGQIKVKRQDGKKVAFPMDMAFGMPRQDGKGMIYMGDTSLGQLIKPTKDRGWQGIHGIFQELALADGRVQRLAAATNADGLQLKHIMIALAIVGCLVIGNIWQFAKG